MTHAELVTRAERWLRNTARCGVVLTEAPGAPAEIPDAIGWRDWGRTTFVVECKASRGDFLADRRKTFRSVGGLGLGRFRYYLAPKGLLKASEMPPGWGLLEVCGQHVRVVRKAVRREPNVVYETMVLVSELRKIQIVQSGGTLLSSLAAERITRTLEAGVLVLAEVGPP
jgi:hypothetical protein